MGAKLGLGSAFDLRPITRCSSYSLIWDVDLDFQRNTPVDSVTIDWTGVRTKRATCKTGAVIFSQGDPCSSVLHIERGTVRLPVVSSAGYTATVGVLRAGEFFGEGCMAGQLRRLSS